MIKILQIAPLPVPPDYRPPEDLPVTIWSSITNGNEWLAENGSDVRAVITHAGVGLPADLWEGLENIGLIASFGVGLDRIDLDTARRRGVRVTYTPNALTDDVADLAIGLMLSALRGITKGDQFVRAGKWRESVIPLGRSLKGLRLGILGLGRIGNAVAKRSEAFGMQVAYHGRQRKDHPQYKYYANAEELAAACDILCVCTPGGDATRKLVNATVLRALGPDGYLVNIARGSVVDESALLDALEKGTIAGAALDVFENEPTIDPGFFNLSNVVVTPHIGSATSDTRRRMADHVFSNIRAYFDGRPLSDLAI